MGQHAREDMKERKEENATYRGICCMKAIVHVPLPAAVWSVEREYCGDSERGSEAMGPRWDDGGEKRMGQGEGGVRRKDAHETVLNELEVKTDRLGVGQNS